MFATATVPWKEWARELPQIPKYDPESSSSPGDWFDAESANHAISFIETCCHHTEGKFKGEPFLLQPWQKAFVGCLFGWKRADGTRRYRELFLYVPRGNGKTPLIAAIALYLLMADGEPSPKLYLVAANLTQANIAFTHACGFIEQSDLMSDYVEPRTAFNNRAIRYKYEPEHSFMLVLSSDGKGKHGPMPHAIIGDELHEWENPKLVAALETSFAKKGRRQPMKLWLTTADYDRESPCNDKYKWAKMVRDNNGDPGVAGYEPQFLPIIYEMEPGDDYRNEKVWEKANPNIDITVDRDALRKEFDKAAAMPTALNELLRLHLNFRVQQADRPFDMIRWDDCGCGVDDPRVWRETQLEKRKGLNCEMAVDLGAVSDLNGLAMLFSDTDGGYTVIPVFWMPAKPSGVKRSDKAHEMLAAWRRDGWIREMPGEVADYDIINADIKRLIETYPPMAGEVQMDVQFQGLQLSNFLQKHGYTGVAMRTGSWTMSPANKEMLRLVKAGLLRHGSNPVLRWMVSNTMGVVKNENLIFDKDRSVDKIDGVVTTSMTILSALRRGGGIAQPEILF